jgi:hypothetical protein
MERWNGHVHSIYSMQKRLLDESHRAESLTPKETMRLEEMLWRVRPSPPSRVTAPHPGDYTSRSACTSTLPPGTSGSRQGLGSRRPHSLAPSSEATSLSLPPTARALQRVSATHWRQEGRGGSVGVRTIHRPTPAGRRQSRRGHRSHRPAGTTATHLLRGRWAAPLWRSA